jgi:hypothetical protein
MSGTELMMEEHIEAMLQPEEVQVSPLTAAVKTEVNLVQVLRGSERREEERLKWMKESSVELKKVVKALPFTS